MSTLTKFDAIKAVSDATGLTQAHAEKAIEGLLTLVKTRLATGGRVEFRGFGIWEVKMSKARVGRNPSKPDSAPIQIPPRSVLRFKAGKELKEAVRCNDNTAPAPQ